MAIVKRILLIVTVLVALVIAIGLVLPGTYRVERSVEIAAPADKVFALLDDPRAWARWTVWNQRDPGMKMDYAGAPAGVGAKWSWDSKTEGKGRMEFTRVEPPAMLEYKLYFPDFDSTSTGRLTLTAAGGGTKVAWSNAGDMGGNPLMRYLALMMDKMVGPDFEAGLKNLKALAEKS